MEKKKNVAAELNPVTKVYIVVFLAVSSLFFGYYYTGAMLAVMIILAFATGKGKEFLVMWLKTIVFITVFCFIMQALFLPGDTVLWKWAIFSIKLEGVQNAVTLCTRILGVGSAVVLAAKWINMNELVVALEERGVSPSATYVLLSTVNIIPQMSKKMNVIMDAQRSRGIETDSNILVRAKAFFPMVGPLILNSVVSAEERAITLEARAFSANCKKTRIKETKDDGLDKGLRVFVVILFVLVIGGKLVSWIVFR